MRSKEYNSLGPRFSPETRNIKHMIDKIQSTTEFYRSGFYRIFFRVGGCVRPSPFRPLDAFHGLAYGPFKMG
jgi:hypothetical protein